MVLQISKTPNGRWTFILFERWRYFLSMQSYSEHSSAECGHIFDAIRYSRRQLNSSGQFFPSQVIVVCEIR